MKITFIEPSLGREKNKIAKGMQGIAQPLSFAILASLTPEDVEIEFFDDRLEDIPFDRHTDLVGISANSATIRRAYELSQEFRLRNIPVILGGLHPTFLPEEAIEHCDSVLLGEAENIWLSVIRDANKKSLKKFYSSAQRPSLDNLMPKRDIFKGKQYPGLTTIEFGRGCCYKCDFCCVAEFFKYAYIHRPVNKVVDEIQKLPKKNKLLFVDSNIISNPVLAKKLFSELIKLRIRWNGYASTAIADEDELLDLLAESGCEQLVIGFESLQQKKLIQIGKVQNIGKDYSVVVKKITNRGIKINAAFMFGYPGDSADIFKETLNFAIKKKFHAVTFNAFIPIPGTSLYKKYLSENKILHDKWWLKKEIFYGLLSVKSATIQPQVFSENFRKNIIAFFSWCSIIKRIEFKANCKNLGSALNYFTTNIVYRLILRSIFKKQKL